MLQEQVLRPWNDDNILQYNTRVEKQQYSYAVTVLMNYFQTHVSV